MNQNDLDKLLQSLKALGDENRLRIIAYLSRAEHNVGSLAELLGVSEPTVSHRLTKLREAGFVNLRTHGNQRFLLPQRRHHPPHESASHRFTGCGHGRHSSKLG